MVATDTAIANAIKADSTSSSSILAAADKAQVSALGDKVGEVYTSNSGEKEYNVTSGIYYIKATKTPANVKSVTNSIVSLPYYQNGAWVKTLDATINLAEKVNDGDVVVTKDIVNGNNAKWTAAGLGDTVEFKLTASVAGSSEMKLDEFTISDTMSEGLTFNSDSVKVTLTGTGSSKELQKASNEFTVADGVAPVTFNVSIADSVLSGNEFYDYTTVEVTYTATVNANAVIGAGGNTNTDSLTYENNSQVATVPGETVKVYTYGLQVEKVDANNTSKKLAGAQFQVTKKGDTTVLATATTDTSGIGVFMKDGKNYQFDEGTYTITETKAPEGYNLNSAPVDVTITASNSPTTAYQTVQITNTASKLPETGGIGNMIFTITGAALIACAGVLFVIVFRKRTSK